MRMFFAQGNVVAPTFNKAVFVVGGAVTISGGVAFAGEVRIEGHVQGQVRCHTAVVARDGSVDGIIVAEEVAVEGQVTGAIYATHLHLKARCDVEGEIYHGDLTLDHGCYFEGKSRRHHDAVLLAPGAAPSA